jgi:hypothetical protein
VAEDFSNHPKSVGEARSARTSDASDWTPRDVLIDVLRDIDAGRVRPDCLIVVHRELGKTSFAMATPDPLIALGLLIRAAFRIQIAAADE